MSLILSDWATGESSGSTLRSVPVVPGQSADLFAFFTPCATSRTPGEAERGKRLFQSKHCSHRHAIAAGSGPAIGPPVERWESQAAPILLIQLVLEGDIYDRRFSAEPEIAEG